MLALSEFEGSSLENFSWRYCATKRYSNPSASSRFQESPFEWLHANGLSWKRLEALGLEYRFVAQYLQEKFSKEDPSNSLRASMLTQLETAIWQYAKRQRTWFKKYAK